MFPSRMFSQPGFRAFLILWASQGLSVFGSSVTYFAVNVWLVQDRYPRADQRPELAVALTLLALAYALPGILLAPLAGLVADRWPRGQIMRLADFGNAAVSGVLLVLTLTGRLDAGPLMTLLMASAVLGAFHAVAFDASYALLVPPAQLARANALMQSLWSLSGLVTPTLAAALVSLPALLGRGAEGRPHSGVALAFGVDGLTFLTAALTLLRLSIPATPAAESPGPTSGLWAQARAGWDFLRVRPALLTLLASFAVVNFCLAPLAVFEPLLLRGPLAPDLEARGLTFAAALALFATLSSAGGLLGGALMTAWGGLRRQRAVGVFVAILLGGAAQVGLGLSSGLIWAACGVGLLALTGPLANAHSQAIWQTVTPPALQGRVFALRRLVAQTSTPLSLALFGALAGRLSPGPLVAGLGGVIILASLLPLLSRQVRGLGDENYPQMQPLDSRA